MPFCEFVRLRAEDSVDGSGSAVGVCELEVIKVERVEFEVLLAMSMYFTQHWILLSPGHGQFGCVIELALCVFNAPELLR
jgi:hypothetical protein